jgi:hypothetical protein
MITRRHFLKLLGVGIVAVTVPLFSLNLPKQEDRCCSDKEPGLPCFEHASADEMNYFLFTKGLRPVP